MTIQEALLQSQDIKNNSKSALLIKFGLPSTISTFHVVIDGYFHYLKIHHNTQKILDCQFKTIDHLPDFLLNDDEWIPAADVK